MSAAPALLPIFVIAFIALVALGVFFTVLVAVFPRSDAFVRAPADEFRRRAGRRAADPR